jgi:diguanylate cyclase (GGDEF)-like protein
MVFGLALLMIWLPYWMGSSADTRSATASLAIAMLYVVCALPLLRRLELWKGRTHYVIGGVFIAAALLATARGAGVFTGTLSPQLTTPSPFNIGLAVIGLALIVVGSMGFVLMLRERELGRLAMLDDLTEIPNRRAFLDALERALASAQRRQFPCSVALIDVDYFKRINDSHGHRAGDDVLRQFAALARGVLRKEDVLGRYGGDEFVLLLYGSAAAGAQEVASRLQAAMAANPARSSDRVIAYTLSVGIVEWRPGKSVNLVELLHQADQALYEAKARGLNCIVHYEELAAAPAVRPREAENNRGKAVIPL